MDFKGSCGDTFLGHRTEQEVLKSYIRFTFGFCLEPHLKHGAAAAHAAFTDPSRNQPRDSTGGIVNAPALKEGGSAIRLQEAAFA